MTRLAGLLAAGLCLAGCQTAPPAKPDWAAWIAQVDALDSTSLQFARAEALRQYTVDPVTGNGLRAAYLLSRPGASLAELEEARDIVRQVRSDSDLAAYSELLDKEIRLRMELRRTQLRLAEQQLVTEQLRAQTGELERRIEGLLSEVRGLQMQLDTLKTIEEDMVETQQQSDDAQQ
jgi:hypothetical protein